jgi:hypothetical protein
VVQAIRNRQLKTAVSSSSGADAMYGLDYEPPNTKEKWLMRSVYWGTILLVAFILWEYVKARQGTESRPLVDMAISRQ